MQGEPKNAFRLRLLSLVILAFLLTSCAGGAARQGPQIPAEFSAAAEIVRGDFTYTAVYTRTRGGEELRFTAPETLAGLCAAAVDGETELTLDGVAPRVPGVEIFAPFALFDAPQGCLTESRDEGGTTVYTGRSGADEYRIVTDGAGLPVRLTGTVGGASFEIRILKYENNPMGAEKGNAYE